MAPSDAELIILQTPQQIGIETAPAVRAATPVKPIDYLKSIDYVLQNCQTWEVTRAFEADQRLNPDIGFAKRTH